MGANKKLLPLPNGQAPEYGVSGVTPEDESRVRALISDMTPDKYPTGGIAFIPGDTYKKLTSQISRTGTFGGMQVGRGDGAQESFGSQGSTHIGDGFSIRSMGRTWLNGDVLNDPKRLKEVLAHELGHFAAHDASEDKADEYKDVYLKRAGTQEQLSKQVGDLPATTRKDPYVVAVGDKVVHFPAEMSEDDVTKAAAQIHQDSQTESTK